MSFFHNEFGGSICIVGTPLQEELTYEGGEERNKWIKDELKEQALKLFPSANFIDGKPENDFNVQVDFEKLDAADTKNKNYQTNT